MKFKIGDLVRVKGSAGMDMAGCPGYNSAAVYDIAGEEHHIRDLDRSVTYSIVAERVTGSLRLKPISSTYFINTDPRLYEWLDIDEEEFEEDYCITSYVEPEALMPAILLKREEYAK